MESIPHDKRGLVSLAGEDELQFDGEDETYTSDESELEIDMDWDNISQRGHEQERSMWADLSIARPRTPDEALARADDIYNDCPCINKDQANTGERYIRVLSIEPGPASSRLRGRLHVRPIFDDGPYGYIALSYAWGTGPALEHIIINDKPFRISSHLRCALYRMRDPDKIVRIWVDAICINQKDVFDKRSQIQIMAQIFNQASEVRIWLGDGFEFLDDPRRTPNNLMLLQTSKWWERLWIIQEVAYAAASPVIMTGQSLFPLEKIMEPNDSVRPSDYVSETFRSHLQLPYQCWKAATPQMPLLDLLKATTERQYSLDHDRIYALLNLLPDAERARFPPDYTICYSQLMAQVNAYLAEEPSWTQADLVRLKWSVEWLTDEDSKRDPAPMRPSEEPRLRTDEPENDVDLLALTGWISDIHAACELSDVQTIAQMLAFDTESPVRRHPSLKGPIHLPEDEGDRWKLAKECVKDISMIVGWIDGARVILTVGLNAQPYGHGEFHYEDRLATLTNDAKRVLEINSRWLIDRDWQGQLRDALVFAQMLPNIAMVRSIFEPIILAREAEASGGL